ncbi:MAG TPA: hypothetical protein VNM92_05620 [Thermoanaerobaculia bacterium]|nr:hypothetical protein [Thermoanaerobaculia bacterium]
MTYCYDRFRWSEASNDHSAFTTTSHLVEHPTSKGINAFTLGDLVGHTSTRTTERYARPSTETLVAVQQALA